MKYVKLNSICNFKQWHTIPTKELKNSGYPVYGANGIIGFSDKYNHDEPTIMICCRGATCGAINVSQGRCYINGNAMSMDNLSKEFDIDFVVYYLKHYDFSSIITGAAQPQITQNGLEKVMIPFIPLSEQKKIVKDLNSIDEIIKSKKLTLSSLDEIIKSRFIEMFETIDLSEQKSEWKEIESVSKIYTGTTPSTSDESNWDGDILWITPAEMNKDTFYVYDTARKITEKGRKSKSLDLMPGGTVLLSTRAPIGKVGIVGKPMTCNQGFKNFKCNNSVNPVFLYVLLKNNTEYLNSLGSGTTFLEVSKSKIGQMKIPVPTIEKQNEFEQFVKLIDKSKFVVQQQIKDLEELLDKKMDEYFGG